jgi:hypothetical protein
LVGVMVQAIQPAHASLWLKPAEARHESGRE